VLDSLMPMDRLAVVAVDARFTFDDISHCVRAKELTSVEQLAVWFWLFALAAGKAAA